MPHRDRVLMGPGPCNPYPEVVEAFTRPLLGHLDPDFLVVLDETCDRLRTVFRTANELTLTAWDPVSKQPIFKVAAVAINKVRDGDGRPAPAPTIGGPAPIAAGVPATRGGDAAMATSSFTEGTP